MFPDLFKNNTTKSSKLWNEDQVRVHLESRIFSKQKNTYTWFLNKLIILGTSIWINVFATKIFEPECL